jgi:glycosyltransferase involved in cell wall biosynthesis
MNIAKPALRRRRAPIPFRITEPDLDAANNVALQMSHQAARQLFDDVYRAEECADFIWRVPSGTSTSGIYNQRGVEFFSLVRGDALLNGRPLRVGEVLRVSPGAISQIKTKGGAELVSHIFPYRKVLCHKPYRPTIDRNLELVSLIVIAKDIEHHVSQCIQSCLLQTWSNVEVIVVVDKSQDETLLVCREFADFDRRITILSSDEQLGANKARKMGLRHAKGEYCLFLDGDDWISGDAIDKLMGVAETQQADVVVFGFDHHSDRTRNVWDPVLPTSVVVTEGPLFYSKEPHWALGVSTLNHTVWMYFFSHKLRDVANAALLDVVFYEDLPFFLALIEKSSKTAIANQIYYHYRRDRIGQATHDWKGVPVGLKLTCLEAAVKHALDSICSDHWFYQLILLYKVERIVLYERKACRVAGDVESAIAWERYWLRITALFPTSLSPLIIHKPTRRRFRNSKSPILRALKFNRHAYLLRKKSR